MLSCDTLVRILSLWEFRWRHHSRLSSWRCTSKCLSFQSSRNPYDALNYTRACPQKKVPRNACPLLKNQDILIAAMTGRSMTRIRLHFVCYLVYWVDLKSISTRVIRRSDGKNLSSIVRCKRQNAFGKKWRSGGASCVTNENGKWRVIDTCKLYSPLHIPCAEGAAMTRQRRLSLTTTTMMNAQ